MATPSQDDRPHLEKVGLTGAGIHDRLFDFEQVAQHCVGLLPREQAAAMENELTEFRDYLVAKALRSRSR